MELFRVHDFQIEVLPEVLALKPFNALYKRDKGYSSEGKRVKIMYQKELLYVYFSGKYNSNYLRYDDKTRIAKLKEALRLPDNWQPDALVEEALAFYKEEQSASATDMLMTTSKGLAVSKRVVEHLTNKMQRRLDKLQESLDVADSEEEEEDINTEIDILLNDMDKLLVTSAKLPKAIQEMKKLEVEAAKEQSEKSRIRGDKDVDKWQRHTKDRKGD